MSEKNMDMDTDAVYLPLATDELSCALTAAQKLAVMGGVCISAMELILERSLVLVKAIKSCGSSVRVKP